MNKFEADRDSLNVAVTGAAGFIGSHLLMALQERGHNIKWAVDSFKPAYDGNWCEIRRQVLNPKVVFDRVDLTTMQPEEIAARLVGVDVVVHLAAFPGVRNGELHPHEYTYNNILSTSALLTACEIAQPKLIQIASSSSVYGDKGIQGACTESEADGNGIKSLYATTKWMNEIQLRDFNRRTGIPSNSMRFFTVFGEWGRPDMAYSTFTESIIKQMPVTIYGKDGGLRNMTYVKDAVEIVVRLMEKKVTYPSILQNSYETFNIAAGLPLSALEMLRALESGLSSKANITFAERPNVDAIVTYANTQKIEAEIGKLPISDVKERLQKYSLWHSTELKRLVYPK